MSCNGSGKLSLSYNQIWYRQALPHGALRDSCMTARVLSFSRAYSAVRYGGWKNLRQQTNYGSYRFRWTAVHHADSTKSLPTVHPTNSTPHQSVTGSLSFHRRTLP